MFSEAFVCPQRGWGWADPPPLGRPGGWHTPSSQTWGAGGRGLGLGKPHFWADPSVLTSSGGHCSHRYTSYWNAFLFCMYLILVLVRRTYVNEYPNVAPNVWATDLSKLSNRILCTFPKMCGNTESNRIPTDANRTLCKNIQLLDYMTSAFFAVWLNKYLWNCIGNSSSTASVHTDLQ